MSKKTTLVRVPIYADPIKHTGSSKTGCPIAICLKNHNIDIKIPWVSDLIMAYSLESMDERYYFKTPTIASKFIKAFDAYIKNPRDLSLPAPFTLVLTTDDLLPAGVQPRRHEDSGHRKQREEMRRAAILATPSVTDEKTTDSGIIVPVVRKSGTTNYRSSFAL